MDRRRFLKAACTAAAGAALPGRAAAEAEDRRPNFLFILTDDQRYDALGCAGNRLIKTPNIDALADALAARGVRFTRAFVTCSARACDAARRPSRRSSSRRAGGRAPR